MNKINNQTLSFLSKSLIFQVSEILSKSEIIKIKGVKYTKFSCSRIAIEFWRDIINRKNSISK